MTRELVYGFLVALFIIALETASLFFVIPAHGAECEGRMVTASWFGKETCHGRPPGHGKGYCETAAGVAFDGSQWLVAHRTLRLGTKVRLSRAGRSVVAPVLDRGPFLTGRSVDLSHAVAATLGTVSAGVVDLCMEVLR